MQSDNLLFLKYQLAFEFLKTKFNSLDLEFAATRYSNPIEHIKYRIKKIDSIEKKLHKKGYLISNESMEMNLRDIVGVRIVCSFLSDMEELIQIIRNDPQIKLLEEKDYICSPKETGYSSYHIIVNVPILMLDEVVYVPAEIQIRTIAMDMWASLEHRIWYKKNIELPDNIRSEIDKTTRLCRQIDNTLVNFIDESRSSYCYDAYEINSEIDIKDYQMFMLKYEMALNVIMNKINLIKELYDRGGMVNPIEHVKGRLKTRDKVFSKLRRCGKDITMDNIEKYVNDIVGIRIVCCFKREIDIIIDNLKSDLELNVIRERDYISNPKDSGYSSYHMLVSIPIYIKNSLTYVKVEIQLRTIAMDMWASLEHKLCYQKEVSSHIRAKLKELSLVTQEVDNNMDLVIGEIDELLAMNNKKKILKL